MTLPDDEEQRETLPAGVEASRSAMFIFDGTMQNELSGLEEESSGTISVEEWGCDSGDVVRLKVDGSFGSEFHDLPNVDVEGEVRAEIGEPPRLRD